METKISPMKLLILDTAENTTEAFISLLNKQGIATSCERISDRNSLFESLNSRQWDILLLNQDAEDVTACINFIRKNATNTAVIMLTPDAFDIQQLTDAARKGLAGMVSLECRDYSINTMVKEFSIVRERRKQLRLEQETRELMARCQLLLSSSRDAIAYIHDGMHIYANDSYLKLFGYSDMDDLLSIPFIDMIEPGDRQELKVALTNIQRRKRENGADEEKVLTATALDASQQGFPARLVLKPTLYEGERCLQLLIARQLKSRPVLARPGQDMEGDTDTDVVVGETPVLPSETIIASLDTNKRRKRDVESPVAKTVLTKEAVSTALAGKQITLVYQPVISTADIEPEFYEVELRIYGQNRETYTLQDFPGPINDTAIGQKTDQWAIAQALKVMAERYKQGQALQFLLTLTAQTIRDRNFSGWLSSAMSGRQLGGHALILNMREADVLANREAGRALIGKLQEFGIEVCISDYSHGEAISSLLHGCRTAFVRLAAPLSEKAMQDGAGLLSLQTIIDVLHADKTKAIALDVATPEKLGTLWKAGVDLVQGSYFQHEVQELDASSFSEQIDVLRNVI
ncbi:MAG: EAL domain-containing protein [Pseudomonadales bacterium]|nr:EAL domain-containing protein [Pseudomonadales bacterium]